MERMDTTGRSVGQFKAACRTGGRNRGNSIAGWIADQGAPDNLESSVSSSKNGGSCRRGIQLVLEIPGVVGITNDQWVVQGVRDAKITDIFEGVGDPEIGDSQIYPELQLLRFELATKGRLKN